MLDFSNPLRVSEFSSGITDKYLNAPPNAAQVVDNAVILKDLKLFTRPGRTFYVSAAQSQLTTGNQRVGILIKHNENEKLFAISARVLNYLSSNVWTALVGPVSSNAALSANATTNYLSYDSWRGHSIITSDAYADPIKVYLDENSAYQVRTAGLPKLELEGAIDLANELKSKFTSHIADTSEHTTAADTTNTVAAADAHDFDTLITLLTELITDYDAHEGDAELAASWVYHAGQESANRSLTSTTVPTTLTQCLTLSYQF